MNPEFKTTIADVKIVLVKINRSYLNSEEVFYKLNHNDVEAVALNANDLDGQTIFAHSEIERQIRLLFIPNKELPFKFKLTLGDWSEDGHNKYEVFVFNSNKPVEELRKAYKSSCRLTGVQFNENENYTLNQEPECIWTEHRASIISNNAMEILTKHGLFPYTRYEPVDLILAFVRLSLPDLEYSEGSFKKSDLKSNIPPFNGWWNKELNIGIGYGLYD